MREVEDISVWEGQNTGRDAVKIPYRTWPKFCARAWYKFFWGGVRLGHKKRYISIPAHCWKRLRWGREKQTAMAMSSRPVPLNDTNPKSTINKAFNLYLLNSKAPEEEEEGPPGPPGVCARLWNLAPSYSLCHCQYSGYKLTCLKFNITAADIRTSKKFLIWLTRLADIVCPSSHNKFSLFKFILKYREIH